MYSAPRTTVSTRNSRCVSCCSFAREGTNNSVKLFHRRTERVSRNCTCIIFFVLHRSLFVCLFLFSIFFSSFTRALRSLLWLRPVFFFYAPSFVLASLLSRGVIRASTFSLSHASLAALPDHRSSALASRYIFNALTVPSTSNPCDLLFILSLLSQYWDLNIVDDQSVKPLVLHY